jgi:hypothetical protein
MSRLLETFISAVSFIKLCLPRHFLLKGQYQVCGHVFVCLCIVYASFYDFDIWFWNYSDGVVFLVFILILIYKTFNIFSIVMCKLSHNCQLVEVDQYLVQGVDITVLNLNHCCHFGNLDFIEWVTLTISTSVSWIIKKLNNMKWNEKRHSVACSLLWKDGDENKLLHIVV